MIPKHMKEFLSDSVPPQIFESRLVREGSKRYLEFTALDVELLLGLGITVDNLGPRLVSCMWDEESEVEVGGYLVVDNLAMGTPAMGGIRMLGDITPLAIHNLARGMTLKNAAADLPVGGGKSGICAQSEKLSTDERQELIVRFGRLLGRYTDVYNPGPDVGTADADMKTIAIENGLDSAVSKPVDMGGNRIDQLGGAARGVVLSIREVIKRLERLKALPQFKDLVVPKPAELTATIQGFGAVGAHTARILVEEFGTEAPNVVGVSDAWGYIYSKSGLPKMELFKMWEDCVDRDRSVSRPFVRQWIDGDWCQSLTFSADFNELLREDAFCFVPAAPVANYLGLDESSGASMTVDRMGRWRMIVEGANTYSPNPERKLARHRLEEVVYREKGVLIVTDYLVNAGGVIYAAHERMIPTPDHLKLPESALGNREAVDQWLETHADEFAELAEKRRIAAKDKLENVIEHNMEELIERLARDKSCLPWEAAEQISVSRISSQESYRKARDVMEPVPTISPSASLVEAAQLLMGVESGLVVVVDANEQVVGVISDRDVTRSIAADEGTDSTVEQIMTKDVISVAPRDAILDCVRFLEQHRISATPVVADGKALGIVSADLLATKTLFRLLQTESAQQSKLPVAAEPSLSRRSRPAVECAE